MIDKSIQGIEWWNRRFKNINEVPIYRFAVIAADHPDLKVIKEAYLHHQGVGVGTDTSLKYTGAGKNK